jgi:hypothetical protein
MTEPTDDERRQFYEDVTTLCAAMLADTPHVGCDACKDRSSGKRCKCECHIDVVTDD